MKQEKVAFFSPPSFKKSLEWPKILPKKGFLMQKIMRNPLVSRSGKTKASAVARE